MPERDSEQTAEALVNTLTDSNGDDIAHESTILSRSASSCSARTSRRTFLLAALATIGGSAFLNACSARHEGTLLSAFEDAFGDPYIGGLSLAGGHIFGARIPMRAHGCALDPTDPVRALFFARRPGTMAFVLNLETQRAHVAFETRAGQHLSGHGVFSADGPMGGCCSRPSTITNACAG